MRAFYVEADWAPKEGYRLSQRESSTKRALRGNSIFKNMRASVVDRPMPAIASDQVLLKVGAAGICGTDVHLLDMDAGGYTMYDGHSRYPIVTGHEFSGVVQEVGREVTTLKPGDMVSVESMYWCGRCEACRRGMFNQCRQLDEPGLTYDGGFAEYAAIGAKHCYVLNDLKGRYGSDAAVLEQGALIEPVGVAYNGLFVCGGIVRPGGHAAVFGAGPIGLAAIALLKTTGAAKIFCFETVEQRRNMAREFGADYVVDPVQAKKDGVDTVGMLMDLTNGQGISTFAECAAANPVTYPVMEGALAIRGKICQIGIRVGKSEIDLYRVMVNAGRISGSMGQSGCGIYADVINLMASGRIDMSKAVSGRVSLENIGDGFDMMRKGAAGKVLVSAMYQ